MNCPYCAHDNTKVLESRSLAGESMGIRRRRECIKCRKRFTTHERVANIDLKVIKKDGRIEDYDRNKLTRGIKKACWKRGVDEDEIEMLVDEIEMKLLNRKTVEIKSAVIGKMVLTRLKRLDGLAYLRFASVYMDFETVGDFEKFMSELVDKSTKEPTAVS